MQFSSKCKAKRSNFSGIYLLWNLLHKTMQRSTKTQHHKPYRESIDVRGSTSSRKKVIKSKESLNRHSKILDKRNEISSFKIDNDKNKTPKIDAWTTIFKTTKDGVLPKLSRSLTNTRSSTPILSTTHPTTMKLLKKTTKTSSNDGTRVLKKRNSTSDLPNIGSRTILKDTNNSHSSFERTLKSSNPKKSLDFIYSSFQPSETKNKVHQNFSKSKRESIFIEKIEIRNVEEDSQYVFIPKIQNSKTKFELKDFIKTETKPKNVAPPEDVVKNQNVKISLKDESKVLVKSSNCDIENLTFTTESLGSQCLMADSDYCSIIDKSRATSCENLDNPTEYSRRWDSSESMSSLGMSKSSSLNDSCLDILLDDNASDADISDNMNSNASTIFEFRDDPHYQFGLSTPFSKQDSPKNVNNKITPLPKIIVSEPLEKSVLNSEDTKSELNIFEEEICLKEVETIHEIASSGDLEKFKEISEGHPDLFNSVDGRGLTSLHLASAAGHKGIIKYLESKNAHVAAIDPSGFTALHIAALNGQTECVQALIKMGSSLEQKTQNGFTALHLAAMNSNLKCCECLMAYGASLDEPDKLGRNAVRLTEDYGLNEVTEYLIKAKDDYQSIKDLVTGASSQNDNERKLIFNLSNKLLQCKLEDLLAATTTDDEQDKT